VRFPKVIRYRKAEATIYGRKPDYPFYRVAFYDATHKRRMKHFATYSEAKVEADKLVKALAEGSQATALSAAQARDALAAIQRIESFRQQTGRSVSLLVAVSEYCGALGKLGEHSLTECVETYRRNLAVVKREDLGEAVKEFIEGRRAKTVSKDGKRPQLSAHYVYDVANWLTEFAETFHGYAVCDLTKEHLNAYMATHTEVGPKTRNERRNVVRMLLKWAVRQDYLPANHRLLEADGMAKEIAEPEEIEFYTPVELRTLLENASEQLRPVLALIALGGVRSQEAIRLTWDNVFRVPGHIEISTAKSKTRARRLTTICPALAAWLEPYHQRSGRIWPKGIDMLQENFKSMRDGLGIAGKRNGLRHGFVSYHFALHANENLTAAESGNSPQMVHKNYKGLATKAEAERWFAIAPKQAENVVPMGGSVAQ
jgi:integrase